MKLRRSPPPDHFQYYIIYCIININYQPVDNFHALNYPVRDLTLETKSSIDVWALT